MRRERVCDGSRVSARCRAAHGNEILATQQAQRRDSGHAGIVEQTRRAVNSGGGEVRVLETLLS